MSLAAGLALFDAVASTADDLDLMLKWPNDLLLGGGKLSGILLEREGNRLVVGIGVNLAHAPAIDGRETAALGPKVAISPHAFAPLLAAAFQRMLQAWRASEPSLLVSLWLEKAHPVGTPLRVHDQDGSGIAGRFAGLEHDGSLRLRLDSGEERIIHAGDVSLAPDAKRA